METYTQDNRFIQIVTALGDELLLQGFSGREGISSLFQFDLSLQMEKKKPFIVLESLIGKKATIKVILADGTKRYFNGMISSFAQQGASTEFTYYHATLVPWLWMLTRTSDCRIFQNLSVPDIIQKIFKEYGFLDFKVKLDGNFQEREYCVQYRETDFNFISRLMEEEGIFYFFEHEEEKHTLVMANHYNKFNPCPKQAVARYGMVGDAGVREEDEVYAWNIKQEVRPGKYEIKDFNFEQPSLDLTANIAGKDERKYEVFEYPGEYKLKDEGERYVGIRIQEEETPQLMVEGASNCRAFTTGYRFKLEEHYNRAMDKEYVLTYIIHNAQEGTNYRSAKSGATYLDYSNQFQCIPYPHPFRPVRKTPVPIVHGTQTAIVVGPKGEEIYVDKYGRVKVQFHWDREGKRDEHSSCWIRVGTLWGGRQWGTINIPRIGQEVIVDFLEGDPDKPIIVGSVYNGEHMPPYKLPDNKTVSANKSRSTLKGAPTNFNEIRFEDKKGSEQVFLHAEKDMDVRIKNDSREIVGHDRHLIVKANQQEMIEANRDTHVKGKSIELVEGENVIYSSSRILLKVGGNFIDITPSGITIQGNMVWVNCGGGSGASNGSGPSGPATPDTADDGTKLGKL